MKNLRGWLIAGVVSGLLVAGVGLEAQAPAVGGSVAAPATAKAPAVVLIIRHAEKPMGETKDPNLTPQGFKRAGLLPNLFLPRKGNPQPRFPKPDALFATDTAKHSNRPIETITPLSQAMGMRINHDFADIETGRLAKLVMSGNYAGKTVLICWHHGEIPHLAAAFGVVGAPKHWDETVFDQVWQITWVDGQATLKMLPEELLPGDSK
jgi:hypothetical protein